jgi:hypothetical protein
LRNVRQQQNRWKLWKTSSKLLKAHRKSTIWRYGYQVELHKYWLINSWKLFYMKLDDKFVFRDEGRPFRPFRLWGTLILFTYSLYWQRKVHLLFPQLLCGSSACWGRVMIHIIILETRKEDIIFKSLVRIFG